MKTAREALAEHQNNFWKSKSHRDCDLWMATQSQLVAQMTRQEIGDHPAAVDQDRYAREIMGIKEEDQFYA